MKEPTEDGFEPGDRVVVTACRNKIVLEKEMIYE
ncbi:hypothetical protein J2Y40_003543 [Chryseobacterium sp. 2987]|nr:hypothetical protein [Chryseobacterium sp. 2987]